MKTLKTSFKKQGVSNVNFAELNLKPEKQVITGFVRINAKVPGEEKKGLMMFQEYADIAEKNSELISIQKQNAVLKNAHLHQENLIKIQSIEFEGYEDVYNLEVPDQHNFSVNGGFIVHNCIDSCRYAFSEDMKPQKNNAGETYNALTHLGL